MPHTGIAVFGKECPDPSKRYEISYDMLAEARLQVLLRRRAADRDSRPLRAPKSLLSTPRVDEIMVEKGLRGTSRAPKTPTRTSRAVCRYLSRCTRCLPLRFLAFFEQVLDLGETSKTCEELETPGDLLEMALSLKIWKVHPRCALAATQRAELRPTEAQLPLDVYRLYKKAT